MKKTLCILLAGIGLFLASACSSETSGNPEAASKEKPAESKSVVLGMTIVPVSAEAQKKLRIKGGVQVTAVAAPASTVGIAEGDLILAVNNTDITSPEQFAKVIAGLDKTRSVGLMVRTGDQTRWVAVPAAK